MVPPCRICQTPGAAVEQPQHPPAGPDRPALWRPCAACEKSGAACAKEGHPWDCEGACVRCGVRQPAKEFEEARRIGEAYRAERSAAAHRRAPGRTSCADGQNLADLPPPWQAWLAQSVCPRARTARIFHASLRTMGPDEVGAVLQGFLAAGPPGRSAFVLVAEADGKDADEAERLSQGLFVRLLHALATLAGEDPAQVVAQTERLSRLSGEPPILWFKDQTFVTMAMSPHYPPSAAGPDPRYAPELCLVLTWASDVIAAQGIAPGVLAEILRRRGRIYNAKVLYDRDHQQERRRP